MRGTSGDEDEAAETGAAPYTPWWQGNGEVEEDAELLLASSTF